MDIITELGKKYENYIRTMPDMSGMDRAREHGWISHEEWQQAENTGTEQYTEMNTWLLQWRTDNKQHKEDILAWVQKIQDGLRIYSTQHEEGFHTSIAQELIEKCTIIIHNLGPSTIRDLGRVAWLGPDYSF